MPAVAEVATLSAIPVPALAPYVLEAAPSAILVPALYQLPLVPSGHLTLVVFPHAVSPGLRPPSLGSLRPLLRRRPLNFFPRRWGSPGSRGWGLRPGGLPPRGLCALPERSRCPGPWKRRKQRL